MVIFECGVDPRSLPAGRQENSLFNIPCSIFFKRPALGISNKEYGISNDEVTDIIRSRSIFAPPNV